MSGKPMTEEVTAQPLGVSQKQGSEEGGGGRGRARGGRAVVWAVSSPLRTGGSADIG